MGETQDRQHDWEQRYRAGHTPWDRGAASPALGHWLACEIPPHSRVLVPGCGQGHEIVELVRAGHAVTAVDIAMQPVMDLKRRLAALGLHAQAVQADLLQWRPAEPFDVIYEQTCICALEPASWADYERRLADWLPPGGRLLALFMQTGQPAGPPYDCPLPAMRALFDGVRWQWPAGPPLEVAHPTGLVELGQVLIRR